MFQRMTSSGVALLIGALGIAGCNGTPSPTSTGLMDPLRPTIAPAASDSAVVANTTIPVPPNTIINNPCTNEGVLVTGTIHLVTITTTDGAGGIHAERHFNVQDVSGIGLITGLHYRGIHTETRSSNASGSGGSELTMVVDIKLISDGSASNLTIRDVLFHVTTNADGLVTASVDRLTVAECQ